MEIRLKSSRFLASISFLYEDSLPQFSRLITLDRELLQEPSWSSNNRCKTHCPECYALLEAGKNCIVRRRSAKLLKQSRLKLKYIDRSGNVVLGKRRRSYWTILCRMCGILFVDSSANNGVRKRRKNRRIIRENASFDKKAKRTLSRKNRAKLNKIQRTKEKLTTKRSLQNSQMKEKTLKDFLIECNLKVD